MSNYWQCFEISRDVWLGTYCFLWWWIYNIQLETIKDVLFNVNNNFLLNEQFNIINSTRSQIKLALIKTFTYVLKVQMGKRSCSWSFWSMNRYYKSRVPFQYLKFCNPSSHLFLGPFKHGKIHQRTAHKNLNLRHRYKIWNYKI